MKRFLLALLLIFLAAPAFATPTFSVTGGNTNAGSVLNFTVRRTSMDKSSAVVTFQTVDGTAKAGTDYAGTTLVFKMGNGKGLLTIPVATYTNQAQLGQTLSLGAKISMSGRVISVAGATIVEPGTTGVPATITCPGGQVILATDTCPAPVPPATGFVTAASVTPISDNFTTANGICDHTNPGAISPAPCSFDYTTAASPDDTGNFRMICGAGQILYDDPIVYPGQPGKSHLHQFYGNLGANYASTYSSLRTTGNSTCGDPTNPAAVNRSGYWMPAMLDGAGHVVKPEYVAIYYKRIPSSDPRCTRSNSGAVGDCVGIPPGLRFISGYNMIAGNQGDAHPFYYCQNSDLGGANAVSSALQNDIPSVIPFCPVGARLTLNLASPDCWDGVNVDSPDHRSHVSHGTYVWDAATSQSYYRCDDAHPKLIPQMTLIAFYVVDANFEAGKWHLSSDDMVPGAVAGSTFHTDYWEAWSPPTRATWLSHCTDGHLQCAGGDLGDGTGIKGMTVPNTSGLVPVP